MKSVDKMIKELPEEHQQEVIDFIEFLLARGPQTQRGKLRQDWAGALEAYREQYTSLELQRKALEWRGD